MNIETKIKQAKKSKDLKDIEWLKNTYQNLRMDFDVFIFDLGCNKIQLDSLETPEEIELLELIKDEDLSLDKINFFYTAACYFINTNSTLAEQALATGLKILESLPHQESDQYEVWLKSLDLQRIALIIKSNKILPLDEFRKLIFDGERFGKKYFLHLVFFMWTKDWFPCDQETKDEALKKLLLFLKNNEEDTLECLLALGIDKEIETELAKDTIKEWLDWVKNKPLFENNIDILGHTFSKAAKMWKDPLYTEKALEYYQVSLMKNPIEWSAYVYIGKCYQDLSKFCPSQVDHYSSLTHDNYQKGLSSAGGFSLISSAMNFYLERYLNEKSHLSPAQLEEGLLNCKNEGQGHYWTPYVNLSLFYSKQGHTDLAYKWFLIGWLTLKNFVSDKIEKILKDANFNFLTTHQETLKNIKKYYDLDKKDHKYSEKDWIELEDLSFDELKLRVSTLVSFPKE